MILVAGLAIAGLAGIAAFYYSMRPGSSRLGAGARPGRAAAAWFAGVRDRNPRPWSSRTAGSSSPARSHGTTSRAAGRTGAEPLAGSAGADPRTGPGEDSAPPVADRRTYREAFTGPWRRLAWRKGADVDQELWPIEAFGGVSDEQFWDDLAADKPLATTARAAQTASGAGTPPSRDYPATRSAAADRTAVQLAAQSVRAAATPSPMAIQPYPARTHPSPTATQPVRAGRQPSGSRERRSARADGPGSDEDPLTSPAYSLRPKGAAGGRSYPSSNRPTDLTREQPAPLRSGGDRADPLRPGGYSPGSSAPGGTAGAPAYQPGPGSAGRYGGTAARLYPGRPHSQSTRPAQSMSTPPYGDLDGYRNPAGPADDPRRANGNWGRGRPGGNGAGEGNWGAHPAANVYRGPYDRDGRR